MVVRQEAEDVQEAQRGERRPQVPAGETQVRTRLTRCLRPRLDKAELSTTWIFAPPIALFTPGHFRKFFTYTEPHKYAVKSNYEHV